jgi:Zn finger protein HypA/HybF involved in hydrogenase expression
MNQYKLECFECDDEITVACSTDIPAFCPYCGGSEIEVTKYEEPLKWESDEDD